MREELPADAKIKVTIGTDGTTTFKVEGVKGSSCMGLTSPFERATGRKSSDVKTGEYREEETIENHSRARR